MKPDEIRQLYNAEYAASYESKFLCTPFTAPDAAHELTLLAGFLGPGKRWLDVACGTGYFTRHFPDVERVGIDLSPAMLDRARQGNPGCLLLQHDYRMPNPEWNSRFDLVSCMWYAYGYAETMDELSRLIANLASWTSPSGSCFVPLADPEMIGRCTIPYKVDTGPNFVGDVFITGITWTFAEGKGAIHRNMFAPSVQYMVEQFNQHFGSVEIVRYPKSGRPALIASGKKPSSPQCPTCETTKA